MGSALTVRGTVYRNDSTDTRLAVMDTETGELIRRADVVRISCELARVHPEPRSIANWSLNVEDVLSDGPIFHQQDAGWPYQDAGYNLRWTMPRGYLESAPATYRLIFSVELTGLRKGTHVVELDVLSP